MVGPQFRWKQEDQATGPRSNETFVGTYVQLEAFRWQEEGIFHAIASYADIDGFSFGRVRKTWLVHKSEQSCCSWYVGGDLAGMGEQSILCRSSRSLGPGPDQYLLSDLQRRIPVLANIS